MGKLWQVARYEYGKRVAKKSFIFSTLGVPVLMTIIIAISVISVLSGSTLPLAYVDPAGVIRESRVADPARPQHWIEAHPYNDEAAARADLEQGKISGYYVLPIDYPANRTLQLYYWNEEPSEIQQDDFQTLLQVNQAAGLDSAVQQRLLEGFTVKFRSSDGKREFDPRAWPNFVMPFVAAFFFFFATMSGGSYMLQAISDEKENRMIEVLSTSMKAEQLVGGKALGLIGVSLTQLLIWIAALGIGLAIAAPYFTPLQQIVVPWELLGIVALYFIPAYALIAGMMTAIGAAVPELRQAQQVEGILNLFFVFPFFFVSLLFINPDSPILVALSLFPTTSFLTLTFRWGLTIVPAWQWIASWLILVLTAGGSIWVAARIFRIGMLRYGQPITLKGILSILQGTNE